MIMMATNINALNRHLLMMLLINDQANSYTLITTPYRFSRVDEHQYIPIHAYIL